MSNNTKETIIGSKRSINNRTLFKSETETKTELNKIKKFIIDSSIGKILNMFHINNSKILNSHWNNNNGNKYYRLISTGEIIFDRINIERTQQHISTGGFSTVYKTIKNKDGNYINIVLKILQDDVNEDGLKDELISSLNGYYLSLNHPDCFPKIYELGLVYQTNGKIVLYTVLDKYFGDITDLMKNSQIITKIQLGNLFKLSLFNILTKQLIIPVYELHKMGFTHLDIKPLNFLYKYEIYGQKPINLQTIECRLTDLASIKKVGIFLDRKHGTEPFISPLYDFCTISGVECKNSFLYDYYSLGITLLHIFLWIFNEFILHEYKYRFNFPFINIDSKNIKFITESIFNKKINFIRDRKYFEMQKNILEAIIANIIEKIGNISSQLEFIKSIELMKSLLLSNTPCFDESSNYSLEITESNNLRKIQQSLNEYLGRNNIKIQPIITQRRKPIDIDIRIKDTLKLLKIDDSFNIIQFPLESSISFENNKNKKYYPIISIEKNKIPFSNMHVNNKKLSSGSFSSIFNLSIKNNRNKYVIKILKNNENIDTLKIEFYGLVLLYYLTTINHKYFANVYEIGIKLNDDNNRQLYSILEKFSTDGIELFLNESIKLDDKKYYFIEYSIKMLKSIYILHKIGYVHLDIKPENFLINFSGKNIICKLTDFSTTRKINELIGINGTFEYISPILYYDNSQKVYSTANIIFDWYSTGIILLKLLDYLFLNDKLEYEYFFPFFNSEIGIKNDIKCMQEKIKFCSNEEYYLLQKNILIKYIDKIFQNILLIIDEKLKQYLEKICQLSYLLLTSNNPFAKNNNHITNTKKFIESLLSTN